MKLFKAKRAFNTACALLLSMALMSDSLLVSAAEYSPVIGATGEVAGENVNTEDASEVISSDFESVEEDTSLQTEVSSEEAAEEDFELTLEEIDTTTEEATTTETEEELILLEDTTPADVSSVNPDKIAEAIAAFGETASKFAEMDEDLSKISKVIASGGNIASAAGGAVAFLQLIGVIEDPTEKALSTIISKIEGMEDSLANMATTLNQLSTDMSKLSADVKEQNRQMKAILYLKNYSDFDTNIVDKLDRDIQAYQGKINSSIKNWWEDASCHTGVFVAYNYDENEESPKNIVYNRTNATIKKIDDFPATADDSSFISKRYSFYVPASAMSSYMSDIGEYHVDDYKDTFVSHVSGKILKDLTEGNKSGLILGTEYEDYSGDKEELAGEMALDLFTTITYQRTCVEMSRAENVDWVNQVISDYNLYSKTIVAKDNGLDALLMVQYVTHGFEGEAKEGINTICDSMIFSAGYYGTFALNVACQSSNVTSADKAALQNKWVDTVLTLKKKKESSLTGNDNFCYVRNAVIDYERYDLETDLESHYSNFSGHRDGEVLTNRWKIHRYGNDNEVSIAPLESDYSLVLYNQYLCLKKENETFAQYLARNGVNIPLDFNGELVTRYTGQQNFALADALSLVAFSVYGNTFTSSDKYVINKTGKDDNCFLRHDKVVVDTINTNNGALNANEIYAASAFYQESHWWWVNHEGVLFYSDGVELEYSRTPVDDSENVCNMYLQKDLPILSIQPISSEGLEEDHPIRTALGGYDAPAEVSRSYEAPDWSEIDIKYVNTITDSSAVENSLTGNLDDLLNYFDIKLDAGSRRDLISKAKYCTYKSQELLLASDVIKKTDSDLLVIYEKDPDDQDRDPEPKKPTADQYRDILGKLAEDVLPDNYFDSDGKCLIPTSAMKFIIRYTPGADFEPIIDDEIGTWLGYQIDPILVVWDSINTECMEFPITKSYMNEDKTGFQYIVPFPVASNNSNDIYCIYNGGYKYDINIQSENEEKYVELKVNEKGFATVCANTEDEYSVSAIDDQTYTGAAIKPTVTIYNDGKVLAQNADYTLSYSNNTKAYTYREGDSNFDEAKAPKVTISGKGNYKNKFDIYFVINEKDLADEDVTVSIADKPYTGSEVKSKPIVKYGKTTLREDTDYTLSYSGNLTDAGLVNVTISGKGNYKGNKTVSYKIYDKTTDISKWFVGNVAAQEYTGSPVKPSLQVKKNKNDAICLIEGTDYSVEYVNNTLVGTATAIITGKGDYATYGNSKKITYKIVQKDIKNAVIKVNDSAIYNGSALKPHITVKDGDTGRVIPSDCYTVAYSKNVNVSSAGTEVKNKPTIIVTGKKNYKGKCQTNFDIAPLKLEENGSVLVDDLTYGVSDLITSKSAIEAKDIKSTVKLGKKTLTRNKDYTVNFTYNSEKKRQQATLVFAGNYSGSVTTEFVITNSKVDINDSKVTITPPSGTITYDGSKKTPAVVVTYQLDDTTITLKEGRDYKLVYANNINAANKDDKKAPSVKVTGIGLFKGSSDKYNFTIEPYFIPNTFWVTINVSDCKYTGKEVKPKLTVINDGTQKAFKASDYTVTYRNNIEISNDAPEVVIKLKGNYGSNELKANFRIYKTDISTLTFDKIEGTYYHTGKQIKPEKSAIKVYSDKKKQNPVTDFDISYDKNVKVGLGKVYVKGTGEYGGTKTLTFVILPHIFN